MRSPAYCSPPRMIIAWPVHTAVWASGGAGALTVVVAVHVPVAGLKRLPVFIDEAPPKSECRPPQTIISLPVQTAEERILAEGAPVVGVGVHESSSGSYSPPLLPPPPQTIIRAPVHTAVCPYRANGAPVSEVGDHWSLVGS